MYDISSELHVNSTYTTAYIIGKWKKIGDCRIVSRRARPTKLRVRDRRMLVIEIQKNRTTWMGHIREELQQELGSFISISTMHNEVNLLCYQLRTTTNKSMIT